MKAAIESHRQNAIEVLVVSMFINSNRYCICYSLWYIFSDNLAPHTADPSSNPDLIYITKMCFKS